MGCVGRREQVFLPWNVVKNGPRSQQSEGLQFRSAYAKAYAVGSERHVKLFRNGRNQAVRIPREFELPGEDATMRREGDELIIKAAPRKSLLDILDTLEDIDERFPEIPDPLPEPVNI